MSAWHQGFSPQNSHSGKEEESHADLSLSHKNIIAQMYDYPN